MPSWSTVHTGGYTTGHVAAPYDMAVGDLDGIPTQDAQAGGLAYHDEAVVAWADSDDDLQLRVVDYNANPSHLLVTAPSQTLSLSKKLSRKLGGKLRDGQVGAGDILVGVGDFDGDGRNEIVVGAQYGSGAFSFSFWRYSANSDGSRTLAPANCQSCGGQPFDPTLNISTETGYADLAVGDFDGDGRDDIAVAFATEPAGNTTDHYANLGIWTLNPDLSTRSVVVTPMPTDGGTLPRPMGSDATRTSSGIRLVAGNFLSDPDDGFGPQRSELAIAWSRYYIGEHITYFGKDYHPYTVTPVVNIYSVSTGNCNHDQTACTTTTVPTNGKQEPSYLFPDNPYWTAYRVFGTAYDAAPIDLAGGGFGGSDTSTDPPVQGLMASAWIEQGHPGVDTQVYYYHAQQSVVVPWVKGDDTHTKWTITDAEQESSNPQLGADPLHRLRPARRFAGARRTGDPQRPRTSSQRTSSRPNRQPRSTGSTAAGPMWTRPRTSTCRPRPAPGRPSARTRHEKPPGPTASNKART